MYGIKTDMFFAVLVSGDEFTSELKSGFFSNASSNGKEFFAFNLSNHKKELIFWPAIGTWQRRKNIERR
jgi:hypothetical protein